MESGFISDEIAMEFSVALVLLTFRVSVGELHTCIEFVRLLLDWRWHCHAFFCGVDSLASLLLTYSALHIRYASVEKYCQVSIFI